MQNQTCLQVLSSHASFIHTTNGFQSQQVSEAWDKIWPQIYDEITDLFHVFKQNMRVCFRTEGARAHFTYTLQIWTQGIILSSMSQQGKYSYKQSNTSTKKRSFRFLQPHLFQIELRRCRPSIHFYTDTISIRNTRTQIRLLLPHAILSPCISPIVQDRFCARSAGTVDVSRLFLLGFSDGATEVMELASTRSTGGLINSIRSHSKGLGIAF